MPNKDKGSKNKITKSYNELTNLYYIKKILSNGSYKVVGVWYPNKTKRKKNSIWNLLRL